MAGFPIRRAAEARLDAVGQEQVFDDIASGLTVKALCDLLEVTPPIFYMWVKANPERQAVYAELRQAMANVLVDDAVEIADAATSASLPKDRERIRLRQWLAERWNRPQYGQQAGVAALAGGVVVMGDLHLSALEQSDMKRPSGPSEARVEIGTVPDVGA